MSGRKKLSKKSSKAAKKSSTKRAAKGSRTPSVRKAKLVEGVVQGKTPAKAARDAGYSESYARVDVYRTLANPSIQERIKARIRDAQVETDEIIGTLVSHMRGDLADIVPDDEFLQQARENGVSHLIKEIEITKHVTLGEEDKPGSTETKYKIKIHDSQAAAKQLTSVFGLQKLPAPNPATRDTLERAIDRLIEKARAADITITPEEAREKLMPYFNLETVV